MTRAPCHPSRLSPLANVLALAGTLGLAGCWGGDAASDRLTRLATLPLGAEVTGLYLTANGDLFLNAQHPSDSNAAPFNRATVGVVEGQDFRALPRDFPAVSVPADRADKQRVRTAVGSYRILGREGYLYTNWEDRPGGLSRLHIRKGGDGAWAVVDDTAAMLDFASVDGTWVNCFGTVTPWGNPLSSEELYFAQTDQWNDRDHEYLGGVQGLAAYLGYPTDGSGAWPNPYQYGYIVEIARADQADPGIEKRYALGRFSHENAVVMPDEQTVYLSDDGTGTVFFKFVADRAGNTSAAARSTPPRRARIAA
ncbi:MAG TPA: alkaline phosphatase PhoX [Gammaproteobacteria bacterium]|nr:alkaline phosphatase PhoX [Gammaproteobacteria bacterium]